MKAIRKFQCPTCKNTHDTEFLAEYCCDLEIKEVFVCSECGEWQHFYDKEKAEACCKDKVAARVRAEQEERASLRCAFCGDAVTDADLRDSKLLGTLLRCRSCILSVAPEMLTAEQIAYGRAA